MLSTKLYPSPTAAPSTRPVTASATRYRKSRSSSATPAAMASMSTTPRCRVTRSIVRNSLFMSPLTSVADVLPR